MEIKSGELNLRLEPSTTPNGEGWMAIRVTVEVPGFLGQFHTEMQPDDFERFRRELHHSMTLLFWNLK